MGLLAALDTECGHAARCVAIHRLARRVRPVRATLRIQGAMEVPTQLYGDEPSGEMCEVPMAFTVSLLRGARRADVKLTIDNRARDHRLRLRVPTGVRTDSILSQGHLMVSERPIERPREIERWAQPPTPAFALPRVGGRLRRKARAGRALKGMYDYEASVHPLTGEAEIRVTLLRAVGMMGRINTMGREGGAFRRAHNARRAVSGRAQRLSGPTRPTTPIPATRRPSCRPHRRFCTRPPRTRCARRRLAAFSVAFVTFWSLIFSVTLSPALTICWSASIVMLAPFAASPIGAAGPAARRSSETRTKASAAAIKRRGRAGVGLLGCNIAGTSSQGPPRGAASLPEKYLSAVHPT